MDNNSLSHTKWTCKYHIVFAPKFRRKVIYQQIRVDVGHILSELCKRKGIEIIEAEACPDHIHMFPPCVSTSVHNIISYLSLKSASVKNITSPFSLLFFLSPPKNLLDALLSELTIA